MFAVELKEQTQKVHTELEKKLVSRIKNIRTTEDYIDLLQMMFGYYHPLQQKLQPFTVDQHLSGHYRGRQAENILRDINYFSNGYSHQPSLSPELPEINSYLQVLGALYVLEGSTLGGRIIAGMISKQLGIGTKNGFSFFDAYGEQTPSMWEDFKLLLNKPWTNEEKAKITDSAIATFSTFKNWINHYESAAHQ